MNTYEVTFRLDASGDQELEAMIDQVFDGPFKDTNASVSYVCTFLHHLPPDPDDVNT